MQVIGFMIVIVGAVLFFGGTISMNRNEKKYSKRYGHQYDDETSREEFFELINQGVRLIRWAGIFLVLTGGALIIIDYVY